MWTTRTVRAARDLVRTKIVATRFSDRRRNTRGNGGECSKVCVPFWTSFCPVFPSFPPFLANKKNKEVWGESEPWLMGLKGSQSNIHKWKVPGWKGKNNRRSWKLSVQTTTHISSLEKFRIFSREICKQNFRVSKTSLEYRIMGFGKKGKINAKAQITERRASIPKETERINEKPWLICLFIRRLTDYILLVWWLVEGRDLSDVYEFKWALLFPLNLS